jgi:hypothetical protein
VNGGSHSYLGVGVNHPPEQRGSGASAADDEPVGVQIAFSQG